MPHVLIQAGQVELAVFVSDWMMMSAAANVPVKLCLKSDSKRAKKMKRKKALLRRGLINIVEQEIFETWKFCEFGALAICVHEIFANCADVAALCHVFCDRGASLQILLYLQNLRTSSICKFLCSRIVWASNSRKFCLGLPGHAVIFCGPVQLVLPLP